MLQSTDSNVAISGAERVSQSVPNVVKKYLSLVLKKTLVPPESVWQWLAFRGDFRVDLGDRQLWLHHTGRGIENALFWKGLAGYEPVSLELWKNASQLARTILDIGANTGLYALISKAANPAAEVYAFEPMPQFRQELSQNIQLNQLEIEVMDQAVSDFIGTAEFFVPEVNQGNPYSASLSMEHYQNHQSSQPIVHQVPVTTLDTIVEQRHLQNIDLVKIDAEGQDAKVLRGFLASMAHNHPDFVVEIQSDEIGAEIQALLPPDRYLYFNIDEEKGLLPAKNLIRQYWLNYWICKPETAQRLGLPIAA
jgi:FkbM family methyltransferase